ncbi:homocitrate synthase [Phlyctema vagabunda]|uniref:Homocitrate synthase n=1 Tax=Phlyctema vagabunda TaxID=108571 RepID=A0ABR4PXW5_9HELO
MRFAWVGPLFLRLISLTSFVSATGGEGAVALGFRLTLPATPDTNSLSQPSLLSLDPNFFVQFGTQELRVPIMPLHLLGKKSWNVYNHDNIEKVKRDEAAARAREEAEEQRMQEIDAERRMQILRGEEPTPILEIEDKPEEHGRERRSGHERKRRKYGENETDYEMRVASDHTRPNEDRQLVLRNPTKDAPLIDHSGHIDLFPQEQPNKGTEKNAEAEKEKAKKQKEYEDQYTMRFSNAAGFKQSLKNPWYSKTTRALAASDDEPVSKDVWGNEDPRRKERQAARIVSSDPLAAMRQGAAQVRQVEKERKRWREQKERELRELKVDEEARKKRKRKYSDADEGEDDLEDFELDDPERSSSHQRRSHGEREDRHRHKSSRRSRKDETHSHSHRHRDRDDDGSRHRHRHRHRHRDRE